MKKKYIVKQNDIKDCGACCLLSIIKYYDGNIPLEKIKIDTKTNINGTTAFNLINAAKKYGLNGFGKKLNKIEIENIILPAIAHITTEKGLNHFVVIYKISKKSIYIMDPAKGYIVESKEEFLKKWSKVILIFKPYKKIPVYEKANTISDIFEKIIINEKKLIKNTIITSIIITILSIIMSYHLKITITSLETNYINTTIFIIVMFLLTDLLKIYFEYYKNKLLIYLNKNVDLKLVPDFIFHILNLPLDVIKSRTAGEIFTRVQELNSIKELFSEIFVSIILNSTLIIASAFSIYIIDRRLFFILCIISIMYILISIVTSPIIYKKVNNNIDLETDFNSSLSENIEALETIKNLSLTNKKYQEIENKFVLYQKDIFEYSNFINILFTTKRLIKEIGILLINSIGIILISKNELGILSLVTFNTLVSYFLEPIEEITNLLPKYHFIKNSFNKISDFINIDPENRGKLEKFSNGNIIFSNVNYSYNDYENIINNINLEIKENSHTIIKGKTGSGKSTLFKMLNKSIEDYKGNIYIKDKNIKDYSINTIRQNILYVSQREKLFTDTIYNNVVLNKKINNDELNKVLKITKVDELINKKELRLDSYLFDSGYNLSGGERQRIILARSILMKTKILILDESLSEVDKETEENILNSIDKYLKNITIIYITHTNSKSFTNLIEMEKLYVK